MTTRHILALALAAGTVVAWLINAPPPTPTPAPPGPGVLNLRGLAVGPTASDDLVTLGALCEELAAVVEWDGMQTAPRLTTGISIEDLRIAARDGRLRGDSIGARQPKLRDAIHKYLDEHAGDYGGEITPAQRSAWVAAFREVSRGCADAAR